MLFPASMKSGHRRNGMAGSVIVVNSGLPLGSSLIEFQSQKRIVAARAIVERKVSGHRLYRVATRLQS